MGRYRNNKLLIVAAVFVLALWIYVSRKNDKISKRQYNVMVWWSPYKKHHIDYHRKCGQIECRFSSDREASKDDYFMGYLFDGAKITLNDLPKTRKNFYDFVSKYKFMIVYEDVVCEDYISSKFWKSLTLGVVPIYFGATNIRNYLPNPGSAILVEDFAKPADLAQFIQKVSNSEESYTSFLLHKTVDFYPITNQPLVDFLFRQDIQYVENRKARTIAEFECYVCAQSSAGLQKQAAEREFTCKLPHFPPGNVTHKAMPRVQSFIEQVRAEAAEVEKMIEFIG
ncbi:hypothetical protein quinque_010197 [Culex quinquefasciatus]